MYIPFMRLWTLPITSACPYVKSSPLVTGYQALSERSKPLLSGRSMGLKFDSSLKAGKYVHRYNGVSEVKERCPFYTKSGCFQHAFTQ